MMGRHFAAAVVLAFPFVVPAGLAPAESGAQAEPAHGTPAVAPALPASLDGLYFPKSQGPVYLMAMHGLNASLAGIMVDMSENDQSGAAANFERFEKQYRDVSRMVPEWTSWFAAEPVEELGHAVMGGVPGEVMAAAENVGALCHRCHLTYMVPVQQKYHWPDFRTITVHDPVVDADLDYAPFMQMLNASLIGIGMNLEQGQVENARVQLTAFRSRMEELKESCDACHDGARAYFVDERVESLLADMQSALQGATVDPAVIASLSQRLGEESCFKCHLVHMPAAYSGYARH